MALIEQACSPDNRYPDSRLVSALLQRNIPEVSPLRGLLMIPCISAPSLGEGQDWILEPGSCPVLAARGLCLLTSSPHLASISLQPDSKHALQPGAEEEALPARMKSLLPVTRPLSPVPLQAGGTDILPPSWLSSAAALDPPQPSVSSCPHHRNRGWCLKGISLSCPSACPVNMWAEIAACRLEGVVAGCRIRRRLLPGWAWLRGSPRQSQRPL